MRKIVVVSLAVGLAVGGCNLEEEPVPVQSAEGGKPAKGATEKKEAAPIKLVARRAKAERSVLSDGGALSCVKVTVTNRTKKQLEVNPLYFSITDTRNTKHDAASALGQYEGQVPTTSLAPGEKAAGMVCAEGAFRPKVIAMTNPLFSEAARAAVS